jgi:periplasmic protein TonB
MFEDSTFESTGKIRTRSRGWMIATFLFNGSVLATLVLIPLIDPEALPRQAVPWLLTAPAPPPTPPPTTTEPQHVSRGASEIPNGVILSPPIIRHDVLVGTGPEPTSGPLVGMDQGSGLPDAGTGVFAGSHVATVVREGAKGPTRVSSGVMEGSLLAKVAPTYPAIAKTAGIQGTVVLQATISMAGTIENLRVVSGPAMLQQAAMDAVKAWRYRPYLLNGEPVEVETTVNVIFAMNR